MWWQQPGAAVVVREVVFWWTGIAGGAGGVGSGTVAPPAIGGGSWWPQQQQLVSWWNHLKWGLISGTAKSRRKFCWIMMIFVTHNMNEAISIYEFKIESRSIGLSKLWCKHCLKIKESEVLLLSKRFDQFLVIQVSRWINQV